MKVNEYIDTRTLTEVTNTRFSQIAYLIQERRIPESLIIRKGSGYKRLFHPEVIQIVMAWKERMGIPNAR